MGRDRWNTAEPFEVPLTPLVDIIFILIVFFLVATTFYSEERDLKVRLPEGTEGDVIAREEKQYVINVRESGVVVVGKRILSMSELESELRHINEDRNAKVEIRGDTSARHGTIMAVMNLCKKCGIANYALTQRIVRDVQ